MSGVQSAVVAVDRMPCGVTGHVFGAVAGAAPDRDAPAVLERRLDQIETNRLTDLLLLLLLMLLELTELGRNGLDDVVGIGRNRVETLSGECTVRR